MKMSDEAEFAQHMDRLQSLGISACIELTVQPTTAIALIGTLQLALRHPGNNGEPAKIMRNLVNILIRALDASSPGIGALLRKGDDPTFDVPVGGKNPSP